MAIDAKQVAHISCPIRQHFGIIFNQMSKIWFKTLSMAALWVVVCGYMTYRMEPKVTPKFVPTYRVDAVQSRLGALPVRLNLDDCVVMTALALVGMTVDTEVFEILPFLGPVIGFYSTKVT